MTSVHLRGLHKSFGDQVVLDNLDLAAESGSYVVLLGPSGCGKTTTLRMIAGLDHPGSGQVLMDGVDVSKVPPRKRDVSMVFQNDGLYPHLNVEQMIRLAIRGRCPASEMDSRFSEAVCMTGIGKLLRKTPRQLSGGELRRAAIATAVARQTAVRLLDEPLAALDVTVRQQLQNDLLQWHRAVPGTTIHVTHDGSEAMRVADQIAVMSGGRIIQIGKPDMVYEEPQTIAVANSIGIPTMNWLEAEVVDGVVQIDRAGLTAGGTLRVGTRDETVAVGVRPTAFLVSECVEQNCEMPCLEFKPKVRDCRTVEDSLEVVFSLDDWLFTAVFDRSSQRYLPPVGGTLSLCVPASRVHVFSRLTGQRLREHDVG